MNNIDDFRFFLTRELIERQKRDPSYSLRRFAKDLKMSAQRLHIVLNRQIGISPKKALEVAEILNLSGHEKDLFVALVNSKHARNRLFRQHAEKRVQELNSSSVQGRPLEAPPIRLMIEQKNMQNILDKVKNFLSDLKKDFDSQSLHDVSNYEIEFEIREVGERHPA